MFWQVDRDGDGLAEFFLYRGDEDVHADHRRFTREELERRVAAMERAASAVPAYYLRAVAAFADPVAESSGRVAVVVAAAPPAAP